MKQSRKVSALCLTILTLTAMLHAPCAAQSIKKFGTDSIRVNESAYFLDADGDTLLEVRKDSLIFHRKTVIVPNFSIFSGTNTTPSLFLKDHNVAEGEIGRLGWADADDNVFIRLYGFADDTSAADRDGALEIRIRKHGTETKVVDIDSSGIFINQLNGVTSAPAITWMKNATSVIYAEDDTLNGVTDYVTIKDDSTGKLTYTLALPQQSFGVIDSVVVLWTANSTAGDSVAWDLGYFAKKIGETYSGFGTTVSLAKDTTDFGTTANIIKKTKFTLAPLPGLAGEIVVLKLSIDDSIANDMAEDVKFLWAWIYWR